MASLGGLAGAASGGLALALAFAEEAAELSVAAFAAAPAPPAGAAAAPDASAVLAEPVSPPPGFAILIWTVFPFWVMSALVLSRSWTTTRAPPGTL